MTPFAVRRLGTDDLAAARDVNGLFGEVFADPVSFASAPPGDAYLRRLLGSETAIVLVAECDERIVGALVAYVLEKFEQERSEIYVYDLAVDEGYRRRGIATALIEELKRIAPGIGAWMIFIQADQGDEPAIRLYEGLGRREEVVHFDIAPQGTR